MWDGFGGHWASSRWWIRLPGLICLVFAAAAAYLLTRYVPGQGGSTTSYFWGGISLIVVAGYLATVATTALFAFAARRRVAGGR